MAGEIKKLYFANGEDIAAATDLGISAFALQAFASDAAYVVAHGAAVDGSAYVSTATGVKTIRMYVTGSWRNVWIETDPADATKLVVKDLTGQTTGTTLTIASVITANRTWTFPDFASTVVGTTGTQSITGTKTFTAAKLDSALITGATKQIDVDAAANLAVGASVGANNLTLGGASTTVVIPGNIQINGTSTDVETTNLTVKDKNIQVNFGGNDASSEGSGLTVQRSPGTAGSLIYAAAATSKFKIGDLGSESEIVTLAGTQSITGTKTLASPTVTGTLLLQNPSGSQPILALSEDPDNGTNVINLQAPNTLAGDLTLKLPATNGSSNFFLQTDGAGNTTWASAATGAGSDSPIDALNYSLSVSVAANAMTIDLKTKGGATPSSGDPAIFSFRNATAATGDYSVVSVVAATSLTVSSGSTLGLRAGGPFFTYIYLINNAGTGELAISTSRYDQFSVQTSLAEGGAGAADSSTALYSTTARSNKAIRLIGRLQTTTVTAGTWVNSPDEISLLNTAFDTAGSEIRSDSSSGHGSTNTAIRRFTNSTTTGTAISTSGDSATLGTTFVINEPGVYAITYTDVATGSTGSMGISLNSSQLTTDIGSITGADRLAFINIGSSFAYTVSKAGIRLKPGDTIRAHNGAVFPTVSDDRVQFRICQTERT